MPLPPPPPNPPDPGEITRLLAAVGSGDRAAAEALFNRVYDELRHTAGAALRSERTDHTLDATALVHEAYLRLAGSLAGGKLEDRRHFFGAAGRAMRRVLVDHARHRARDKRPPPAARADVDLDALPSPSPRHEDPRLLQLDAAIARLESEHPLEAEVVHLHYFAGLSHARVAELLAVSPTETRRRWDFARAFLRSPPPPPPP